MDTAELADLTDKMNPMHSGMLCAMLQVKELPRPLVLRYFAVKKYLDRVDAPVSPMGLFLIAQQAGYAELDIEEPAAKDDEPEQTEPEPETVVQPEVAKIEKPVKETEQAQESGEPYPVGQTVTVYFKENYVEATVVGKKGDNILVEIDGQDGSVEITPEEIEDD